MKKLLAIVSAAVISLLAVGCSLSRVSAKDTLDKTLTAIIALDQEVFTDELGNSQLSSEGLSAADAARLELTKAVFSNSGYVINDATENDDSAALNVTVTAPDFTSLMNTFSADYSDKIVSGEIDISSVSKESFTFAMYETVINAVKEKNCDFISTDITINMTYAEGEWSIDNVGELTNAFLNF